MAVLYRLVSVGGETAGFLLPIFHMFPGANQELIQRIDQYNRITSLEAVQLSSQGFIGINEFPEVHVGDQALWVFRDQNNALHMGRASDVQLIGKQLLSSGSLDRYPMAAAEMAAFCQAEADYPKVMVAAFDAIKNLSSRGAEAWRDSVILLPLIKQDMSQQIEHSSRERAHISDVFAITKGTTTHIYASPPIAAKIKQLPRWQLVSKVFGISDFVFHFAKENFTKPAEKVPEWSLFGVGGVARFVIQKSPFFGSLASHGASADAVIAHGPPIEKGSFRERLVIAVATSDARNVELVKQFSRHLSSGDARKHAINIRPIGFGTSQKQKLSPTEFRNELDEFNSIWIIANHRQRQTGKYWNSLSASNAASRFVKGLSESLIACLDSPTGRNFLVEAERGRGFGLFGSTKYDRITPKNELIQRVLCSMLCEDALLHTASKIVIIWPNLKVEDSRERVELGAHIYDVELMRRPKSARFLSVVGLAANVQLSNRSELDFIDFCRSLMAGYGWHLRSDEGHNLLFASKDETLRIWPVISAAASQVLLQGREGHGRDLIISNQTVSIAMSNFARTRGWNLMHYSELDRWIKLNRINFSELGTLHD